MTGRRHDAELVARVLSRARQDVLDELERIFARRTASRAAVRSAGELSRRLRRRVPSSCFTAPFLVHDDLEDVSEFRRGRATMLKEHGVTGAINVGDDRAHRSGTRFLNVAYPDALTLGLWERGTVIASLAIPAKAGVGEEREGLIWVRGDRDHVLRWTVRVTAHAGNCCHQVDVADCPDLVHHWYVHFYCERPGSGGSR